VAAWNTLGWQVSLSTVGSVLCGLSAVEHVYIFSLETFSWFKRGRKVFAIKDDAAAKLLSPVFAQVRWTMR
jgi:uncharacterized membrane protein